MVYDLLSHFQMLATYNRLANQRLYEACASLSDSERQQIRPAFFKSIHGTLNHILVGDRIWLGRFEGKDVPVGGLDVILYDDFTALHGARIAEDAYIEEFVVGLGAEFLGQILEYRNSQGTLHADPIALLIAHFFNHQTHHRGQVHDLLTQTTIAPPSLDMHRIMRSILEACHY